MLQQMGPSSCSSSEEGEMSLVVCLRKMMVLPAVRCRQCSALLVLQTDALLCLMGCPVTFEVWRHVCVHV